MKKIFEKATGIKEEELHSVIWALIYIISLFLSYYVLRPIRDELGVANGVDKLPWLFTGTLIVMLLVSPVFSYMVRKLPREKFIPWSYRFLSLNLFFFSLAFLLGNPALTTWISRAFFIWVSVFNLFAISIFWSFIVDIFNREQGKRLFGIFSAGATLGGLLGATTTSLLINKIGNSGLFLVSIIFIELAVYSSKKISLYIPNASLNKNEDDKKEIGGGIFSGMMHTFKSPYLLAIAAFILLYSITSTFLYYQQANITSSYFHNRDERTTFFANIDILVNVITLFLQIFITGKLIHKFGVILTLCALPFISIFSFAALGLHPIILVLVIVQVVRRVLNFSFARPTRELLFTSSSREDRYKAKNFIDTVVYRGGDQVAGWGYSLFSSIGFSVSQLAFIAVPISVAWLLISVWLSKKFNINSPEV